MPGNENKNTSGFMPIERKIELYISNGWIDTFRLFHDEGERYSWWTYRFNELEKEMLDGGLIIFLLMKE